MLKQLRHILASEHGASAIEFAFMTPILVLLLLASSDYVPSFTARFKSSHANGSFGDLIAQGSALRTADVATFYNASGQVIAPFDGAPLYIRVSNIYSDGQGHAYVYWSCGEGSLPPYAAKSGMTTTPNGVAVSSIIWLYNTSLGGKVLNGTNTSFVLSESTYSYSAPAQFVLRGAQTMTSTYILYPRQSAYVGFPWDGNANDAPTVPNSTTRTSSVSVGGGVSCNYAY